MENNWISVKDRLPELNEALMGYDDDNEYGIMIENYKATVLGFDPEIGIFKAEFVKGNKWIEVSSLSMNSTVSVTHWMFLPELPSPPTHNP